MLKPRMHGAIDQLIHSCYSEFGRIYVYIYICIYICARVCPLIYYTADLIFLGKGKHFL